MVIWSGPCLGAVASSVERMNEGAQVAFSQAGGRGRGHTLVLAMLMRGASDVLGSPEEPGRQQNFTEACGKDQGSRWREHIVRV